MSIITDIIIKINMINDLKRIIIAACSIVVILFILFAVNQLMLTYDNLLRFNEYVAMVVVSALGLVFLLILLIPVMLYVKLPEPLPFPDEPGEYKAYHRKLRERLVNNPVVKSEKLDPHDQDDYQLIQQHLQSKANKVINESASAVFLSTAVSQNGKLDAFAVLAAQTRLVWKVAHVYWQRPSWKNLAQLYAHVAFNSLAATGVEQLDLSRQIEPIIRAMVKSPARTLPFVGDAAHIVTNSILEGSINAFLTLRVGVLTRNYCFPDYEKLKDIRKKTYTEASGMLTTLVISTSGQVIESLIKAGKNVSVKTIRSGYDKVGQAFRWGTESVYAVFKTKQKSGVDDA